MILKNKEVLTESHDSHTSCVSVLTLSFVFSGIPAFSQYIPVTALRQLPAVQPLPEILMCRDFF
jgi:hypothetical protein